MSQIIKIENLKKTYKSKKEYLTAIKNINLSIEEKDIFGIIGLSGAGKSTLIRCINFLEKPTEGKVYFKGIDLSSLKNKDLLKVRQNIGMIFQNFNLLEQRTVLEEIAENDENLVIMKIDKDLLPELAMEYKVSAIPALFFLKNGEVVGNSLGFIPKPQLERLIKEKLD